MKRSILAFAAAALLILSSCKKEKIWGEGPVITETRNVSNFSGISSGFSGIVNFKIDPVYKVEIQAQQNVLEVLNANTVNGILKIDYRRSVRVQTDDPVIVNISAPSLDFINLSGSGDINVTGHDVASRLDINLSGNGNINVQEAVISDKIVARISGSGDVRIPAGSAKQEDLQISGSGNITLSGVPAETGEIHISGSGDVKVNLSQSLEAHISGSGDIWYLGNPVISSHISGSGRVRPL